MIRCKNFPIQKFLVNKVSTYLCTVKDPVKSKPLHSINLTVYKTKLKYPMPGLEWFEFYVGQDCSLYLVSEMH